MKVISAGLLGHLQQDTTTLATCVKLTRRDGLVLGYTTHDRPLTFDCDGLGAVTYQPQGGYKRSAIESQLGLAADNLELEGLIDDDAITDQDLLNGLYDNAALKFMLVNWQDVSQGVLKLRAGYVGQITLHRDTYVAEIRGLMDRYSTVIGEIYTPDCRADLYDQRCQVDPTAFRVETTVATIIAPGPGEEPGHTFTVALDGTAYPPSPPEGSPWFLGGAVIWTSGANAGARTEIKSWLPESATVSLYLAPTFPVQVGDALTLEAGCDKMRRTCKAKYDNIIRFRGEPYLPGLDAALSYPSPHSV